MDGARILLLGDTHVGFDTPRRPRVTRRRRGPDFLKSFERALAPALEGDVDLVVHGGDLLDRSRLPAHVVESALAPLRRVAERGVPVFLIPGNHERSRIPFPLLAQHPNLFIFHGPDTFSVRVRGLRVALSGFPFARRVRGSSFRALLDATGWQAHPADVRILCIHQAVEGSRVSGFTFGSGPGVVAGSDLPAGFDAVLSGHIHRHQVLVRDLCNRPLAAPVFYAGSVERTSFAERDEVKGTLRIRFAAGGRPSWQFDPLPTRPMHDVEVCGGPGVHDRIRLALAACPADAVVRLDIRGCPPPSADELRAMTPPTMNVATRWRRPA